MVSWRNITEELGHLTWDDYIERGVLQALEVSRAIRAVENVNALGFCVGGTMLGAALAVMGQKGEKGVQGATFLASMDDFSHPGCVRPSSDEPSWGLRQ